MEKLTLFDIPNTKPSIQIKKKAKAEIKLLMNLRDDKARIEIKEKNIENGKLEKTGKFAIPENRKTSRELIIPQIKKIGFTYDLGNKHWKYEVKGAFLDALGIKWIKEYKNKKVVWEGWKQTAFLDFNEGDSLDSRCGTESLQVEDSSPIMWDFENEKMIEGFVRYKIHKVKNGSYDVIGINSCTQMEFLEKLIYGRYEGE